MSVPLNHTSFIPSASATFTPPTGGAQTFALPAVDSGNTAMTVTNNSTATAWVQLGTAATGMNPGPVQKGSMVLAAGQTVLLTTGNQGTATYCAVLLQASGGSVAVSRGTATNVVSFSTCDDAVII